MHIFSQPIRCLVLFGISIISVAGLAEEQINLAQGKSDRSILGHLTRRLQFVGADGINHFRYTDKNPGQVTTRDIFYKTIVTVRVSLVGENVTYLQGRGESGRSFISSYDYTGIGPNHAYWSFNMKSFFLGQKFGRHFEAQVGGLEFDRGAGTEATYADNDGWMEGYRLVYRGSGRHQTPDKVSATIGYVGDWTQPNMFARAYRMGEVNYFQLLFSRKLTKAVDASAEYDSIQGISYSREALHWQKLPLFVVDELSLEALTRASDNSSFGWSGSLFRMVDQKGRIRLGLFYSDMPAGMYLNGKAPVMLNGDSYVWGKRIGPTLRFLPVKNFEIGVFGSNRCDRTAGPRYRAQFSVRYQFADLLNQLVH